jgi:hypothetical protein
MRNFSLVPMLVLLAAGAVAAPPAESDRSLLVLFGPAGSEVSRQAAHSAASTARRWFKGGGTIVEVQRAGQVDAVSIPAGISSKELEQAFVVAARVARDTDPATFVNSLDGASQSLARRPGLRLLLAVLEDRPLSGELESTLKQLTESCQASSVHVVLLIPYEHGSKDVSPAWKLLAHDTGGALVRDIGSLETSVLLVAPDAKAEGAAAQASIREPAPAAEPVAEPAKSGPTGYHIPVYTRFVSLSAPGTQAFGIERSYGAGRGGVTSQDAGSNLETTGGVRRGVVIAEAPLKALKFEVDDHSGTYLARARITQIARNAAGQAVWTAKKEVSFKGPLRKLEQRQSGTLFQMRQIQLPAGKYTVEATVEDLLAGSSGTSKEPVLTFPIIPGFALSDAVLVRPAGGADRFEADMVFTYDGNAIAPLLNPVFKANEPFDLQLYVVLYPDLFGAQPELSLEILRNGKSVRRMPLPFLDQLRDDTKMGHGATGGEQKHEFTYLATLKGATLNAGEFEARISVRQDKNVLTRSVAFSVVGSAAAPVPVERAGGPLLTTAPEEDLSAVVLPEVDPVTLHTGATLPEGDQKRLWEEAAASALGYSTHLPNFRCKQETHRLSSPVKLSDQFHEGDVYLEELSYENGKESYRTLEFNGLKADKTRSAMRGVHSRGEFGTMLRAIFSPELPVRYKWVGRTMAGGALCDVFEIEVPKEKSNFVLYVNTRQEVAGYTGRIFIDEEAGLVRRIMMSGTGLPKDFGFQSPTFSLEYGMVRVGTQDYLLPLRSVFQARQGRNVVRNEAVFRDYRKFEASSEIHYNN